MQKKTWNGKDITLNTGLPRFLPVTLCMYIHNRPLWKKSFPKSFNAMYLIKFHGIKNIAVTLVLINTRPICSVWSKIDTFQRSLEYIKIASIILLTLYVFATIKSFKMRYCMNFYLKGHQKYEKSNFWLSRFT